MNRLHFPDRRIPMHHGESLFRDPFLSKNGWNHMDQISKVTEKHMEKTSTHSSSTQEEIREEFHEEKLDGRPLHPADPIKRTRFETVFPSSLPPGTAREERTDIHHEETHYHTPKPTADSLSKVVCDPEQFQVLLEVEQYMPDELSVKTADHYVIVEGKHKELKQPRGYLTRQFTRKYLLPIDCKPENVTCNLTDEGLLVISVPRENINLQPLKEVIIDIQKSDQKMKKGGAPGAAATAA